MNKCNSPYPANKSRRKFIKNTGGAIFYVSASFSIPAITSCKEAISQHDALESTGHPINVWVKIHANDHITIYNPAAEMGQGSMSALAVIIAEELDADWEKVRIKYSEVEPEIYGSESWGRKRMITVGSRTVASYYDSLRQAGAQARHVLLYNAAQHWQVPVEELVTEPNLVVHTKTNRRMSYGEITTFLQPMAAIPNIPENQLKDSNDFRLIGKIKARYDVPSKTDGSAQYAIDVKIPGMVIGMIERSPVHGSSPTIQNEEAIRAMDGVVDVIKLDHGIGILASSFSKALKAKKQLKIDWSTGNLAEYHTSDEAYSQYEKVAKSSFPKANILEEKGDVESALHTGIKTYDINYKNDYVYHAQTEPLNAVVSLAEDNKSAEVWVGTQSPAGARSAVASELGIAVSDVKMHLQYLGGGFGRRSNSDYVVEAAQLAKAAQLPVKLIWTREDDLRYGMFRPMSLQRMQASVDKQGKITAWKHTIVGTGGGLLGSGAKTDYYHFPNQKVEVRNINHGVRTKHWRAVGHGPNKYAIEAFIDEIAVDQNIDPFDLRMDLMKNHPRAQVVLRTVAEMADWGSPVAGGRAKGLSFAERSGSLSACVCELSLIGSNGKIKVHNVWASLDAGVVVQPDNAIAQMEGAITMGLSSLLKERITFKDGKVEQSNFHDYPILTMQESPDNIEIKIIPSKEPPTGIGESGVPIIGGAFVNAFASLTNKRLRHMPFTPAKIMATLES